MLKRIVIVIMVGQYRTLTLLLHDLYVTLIFYSLCLFP